MNNEKTMSSGQAIIVTLLIVVIVRELSVLACSQLGVATAGNIVGLIVMFMGLLSWRLIRNKQDKKQSALPHWLTQSSNTLLTDSGFAFLPVSAGAGILLFALQDEFWGVVATIIISTLIPLWGFAKITDIWLKKDTPNDNKNNKG